MPGIATGREGCRGVIAIRGIDAGVGAGWRGIDGNTPGRDESWRRGDQDEDKEDAKER